MNIDCGRRCGRSGAACVMRRQPGERSACGSRSLGASAKCKPSVARLLFLLRLKLLDVFLRVIVEGLAAPATADVIGLPLVAHPDRPQPATHDALRIGVSWSGKDDTLLG